MSTFVVRVVDSADGRLRGVVERISDQRHLPFSDSSQLLAFLANDDRTDDSNDGPYDVGDDGDGAGTQ